MEIIETGYDLSENVSPEFKIMIIDDGEYSYNYLEQLAYENDVDMVCVDREGTIAFTHFTEKEFVDSIRATGLEINKEYIGDLGQGIYVVQETNWDAYNNAKDNVLNPVEVTGIYNGPYRECIYGEDHVGYIMLKTDRVKEVNIHD